jgi:outer membrane usher protein
MYSKALFGRLNLIATFRRQLTEPRGNDVFVGLQYVARDTQSAQASMSRDVRGTRTTSLQWGTQAPQGEGVAYSLAAQRQEASGETTHVITPRIEWNTRVATLGAEATQVRGTTSTTAYSLSLSGALVAAQGRFDLSRAVADSFAIVEITPPLEGVMVYENSQEVGRTDSRGRVLLPNIASYAANYASIKDKDVPIEYSIDKVGRSFSPPYRSGTLVPFRFERVRAFTGTLRYRLGGEVRALEHYVVQIEAAGRRVEMPTGNGGAFYVENLPPGRLPATVRIHSTRCDFVLEVPAGEEAQVALGDIMACHVAR